MTKELNVKPVKKKRRKVASLEKKKARGGWIFVLPFILGFALIYLPIIFDSFYLTFTTASFENYETVHTWAGFVNYKEAIVETDFVETLITGLSNMIYEIPMILIFSLFMAVLLNQKMAGRAVFRAIFFVPVILSTGLMASIEAQNIVGDSMGNTEGIEDGSGESAAGGIIDTMDVQKLFSGMAIGDGLLEYVTMAINNIYDIVNRSGVQMLIFLSGLQSISPAIYESVQIDGASAWETFWKITFPMISPMILVNAVYTIIDSFTAESNVIMSFISKYYMESDVVSTAMSWMYFAVVLAIVGLVALILSSYVFYQRRD